MLICPNSCFTHPDQGMTSKDIDAAKFVANQRNEIIIFRATGCWSRPYMMRGHPTKSFHLKKKSATWGPQAGLVPFDSEYSKADMAPNIKKRLSLNQDVIEQQYARPIPLFLTEKFIRRELLVSKSSQQRPAIERMTTPRPGTLYFFLHQVEWHWGR